jgi:hypothetical protein
VKKESKELEVFFDKTNKLMRSRLVIAIIVLVFSSRLVIAQDSIRNLSEQLSSKYIAAAKDKAGEIANKLGKKSQKALSQFKKKEDKIIRKLAKIDSSKAVQLATSAKTKYEALETRLKNPGKIKQYIRGLDSMSTSLSFLASNSEFLSRAKEIKEKAGSALSKVDELKVQLQKAEDIKAFLRERKRQLKEHLEKLGFPKELKQLNKQAYYYAQQIKEYKDLLNNPRKIEKKVLELLPKTKWFQEFFRKNSMLASLFRLPGNSGDPNTTANLTGLQTRAQVNSLIQTQIAAGGPDAMEQFRKNMQGAQLQLNDLKSKINQSGIDGDGEMPDFKPNSQKTKSFFKRWEYGFNIQSQKGNNFFPATSDIALFGGFKIDDKRVIGIGASYKLGLGNGWNNIRLTHQGIGLRSYIDWKFSGSFLLTGGYEQNYRSAFRNIAQLNNNNSNSWQQSGLIGIGKKYKAGKKLNGRMQLLWDFLSYRQIPRTQPVIFRIGFSLK